MTPQTRWNLLGAEVDPLGHRTEYAYTSTERVSRVVDPGGTSSEYGYDEKDRLIEVRRHGVRRETYVYDAGDRLLAKHAADGRRLVGFEYDERALATRLVLGEEDAPEGEVRFGYDGAGRVVAASTEAHQVLIRRDARGRVREDRVDGVGLERLRGGTATFERWFGRFESVRRRDGSTGDVWLTDPTGGRHRLRVVSSGLVVREHANGTVEAARYDEDGRLWGQLRHKVAQDGAPHLHARRYTYTPAGDLVSLVDTEQGRTEHVTDAAHRLSETRYPDGRVVRYVRDPAGNLLEKPGLSAVALAGNRLRHANGHRYTYDDRPRLRARRARARAARCTRREPPRAVDAASARSARPQDRWRSRAPRRGAPSGRASGRACNFER